MAPPSPKKRGEFEIIARYFAPLAAGVPGAHGLKDDTAFLDVPHGQELVVKTDAAISGVHFMADDPADLVARKTLRRNLSDLAAKGAVPRWYLVNAAFAKGAGERWIATFAKGLAQDQAEYGLHLVGGDTKATPGPAMFAFTVLGLVRATWGLHRGGAHAGDDVYVTGTIGDSALGLMARQGKLTGLRPKLHAALIQRYRLPLPRLSVGQRLLGVATASIDVSDGLVADAGHVSATSKLALVIEEGLVPLSSAAKAVVQEKPALMEHVLTGGDDYEILFTAHASAEKVLEQIASETGVPITRIGKAEAGKGVTVFDRTGRRREFARTGWVHF